MPALAQTQPSTSSLAAFELSRVSTNGEHSRFQRSTPVDFLFRPMAKFRDFKSSPFHFSRFPGILERSEPSRPGKRTRELWDSRVLAKSRFLRFPDLLSISFFERLRNLAISKVPPLISPDFPGSWSAVNRRGRKKSSGIVGRIYQEEESTRRRYG